MKRVGLIDNLSHIAEFRENRFHEADAEAVMAATGGNTGNVAFVHGTRCLIANPMVRAGWNWDAEQVRKRFDHLVVCCANQLGSHTDLAGWADRIEKFSLPVTLIGLGAQSESLDQYPLIPDGTRRFLAAVRDHACDNACNIAVRGEFTRDFLQTIDVSSSALGCPSLFISSDRELGQRIKLRRIEAEGIRKVVVAAGNPWHAESAMFERLLVEVVDGYRGEYVVQHPESMIQFALAERSRISEKSVARFLDVYGSQFDLDGLLDWYRRNASVFVDVPNWMRFMRRADLCLGPRYHGVALAVQAGVPGCVVTIDSRTAELCAGTAIKNFPVSEALRMSPADLVERSLWSSQDADRFDENRLSKARLYRDFLGGNGLAASEQLLELSA